VVPAGHVEDQAERIELGETLAEGRIQIQSRLRGAGNARVRVPRAGAPDAAKASGGGGHLRLQHGPHSRSAGQVGVADDACRDLGLPIKARGRHCRDAVRELDLADVSHLLWSVGAVHRKVLDEHRRDDVVTALQVAQDLVQQIASVDPPFPTIPEVMMRVADRQSRVDGLLPNLRQPVVIGGHDGSLLAQYRRPASEVQRQ
jgi:hypothetical protein